ncbi:hypothetical protein BJAS_P3361 [Bathymodiolus japonicus methanotrophic gill symbiont]|uniref:BT4734/BF3469 family protein n=1 Tax=Bathymodiolus japonicus methanotrophic gill symbiont TaxID=113269 RepID=UPI001B410FDF|nr:hypothetical protein BJAS_P3361 [Bathymodiolus japonicus methanotrophic gill symbiont]
MARYAHHMADQPRDTCTIREALEAIKTGSQEVFNARDALSRGNKGTYDDIKGGLEDYTFSGVFLGERTRECFNPDSCTNTFLVDIDNLPINDVETIKDRIASHECVRFVFISPSGNGLKVGLHVPTYRNDAEFKVIFEHVEKLFKEQFNVPIDRACKDINRFCYTSFDENIYIKEDASMLDIDVTPKLANESQFDAQFETVPADTPPKDPINEKAKERYILKRGVAIFAKACFGHPCPSKRQKLNATANAFGAPDVLRTCHFATPS